MKQDDIHNNLSSEEVRKLLAKLFNRGAYYPQTWILEQQIKDLQQKLLLKQEADAAKLIMDSFGWRAYDISDKITDYTNTTYYPFVGTEEEKKKVFGK